MKLLRYFLARRLLGGKTAGMNNENGLPPEVQKFLDTHLKTEAEKQLFLKTYAALKSEQERQKFLADYAEEPTDAEHAENLRAIEARKKSSLN